MSRPGGSTSFEDGVTKISHILLAQRLFGVPDYRLHVIAADLLAFQHPYETQLTTLPGVQRLTSTLVMKTIIEKDLPLD
jgi:DNA-binding Lrp family transcriptional regulator